MESFGLSDLQESLFQNTAAILLKVAVKLRLLSNTQKVNFFMI